MLVNVGILLNTLEAFVDKTQWCFRHQLLPIQL